MSYKKKSSDDWEKLEMHYNKEKNLITPILPKNIKPGKYPFFVKCTDFTEKFVETEYEMYVHLYKGKIYSKFKILKSD